MRPARRYAPAAGLHRSRVITGFGKQKTGGLAARLLFSDHRSGCFRQPQLGRPAAQHQLLGRAHLIQPRDGAWCGALVQQLRLGVRLGRDGQQRLGERVQRLACSRSRSARSSALRGRSAGSSWSAGDSRNPSAAWKYPGRARRARRATRLPPRTRACRCGRRARDSAPRTLRQQVVGVEHRVLRIGAQALWRRARGCRCRRARACRTARGRPSGARCCLGRHHVAVQRRLVLGGRPPRCPPAAPGKKSTSFSLTPTGPEPGPPPPCGVEKVLCRL